MKLIKIFVILVFTGFLASVCLAKVDKTHKSYQTKDFNQVVQEAKKFGTRYGARHVLLVFDMDDTLLMLNRYLGSVPWWNWQSHLFKYDPTSRYLVAHSMKGLLKAQLELFALFHMHPVDPKIPLDIQTLQRQGYKAIVLTVRDATFRSATQQSLNRNHLSFVNNAIGPSEGYPGMYMPYRLHHLSHYGINASYAQSIHLGRARPVSYMNGILMVAGQNKGLMLLTLLQKTHFHPRAIVFIDDTEANIVNFNRAFKNSTIKTVAIHYVKDKSFRTHFNKQEQVQTTNKWDALQKAIAS